MVEVVESRPPLLPEMEVVCCARPIRSLMYFIPGVGRAWGGGMCLQHQSGSIRCGNEEIVGGSLGR